MGYLFVKQQQYHTTNNKNQKMDWLTIYLYLYHVPFHQFVRLHVV